MRKVISFEMLKNKALSHLERYETSTQRLRIVLLRRIEKDRFQGRPVPPESHDWVEQIVAKMQELGYVNDTRYAENKTRLWRNSGKGANYISLHLKLDGIDDEAIYNALHSGEQSNDEIDLNSARKLAKKRHLGEYKSFEDRQARYKKEAAFLTRSGYSFDIVRKVLVGD